MNQTCRTLLVKQGRAHKLCTPMFPCIWPSKSRTTSSNIQNDREKWRERLGYIRARGTTWLWSIRKYINLYIYVLLLLLYKKDTEYFISNVNLKCTADFITSWSLKKKYAQVNSEDVCTEHFFNRRDYIIYIANLGPILFISICNPWLSGL